MINSSPGATPLVVPQPTDASAGTASAVGGGLPVVGGTLAGGVVAGGVVAGAVVGGGVVGAVVAGVPSVVDESRVPSAPPAHEASTSPAVSATATRPMRDRSPTRISSP